MTFAANKHFPTILGPVKITTPPLAYLGLYLPVVRDREADHGGLLISRAAPQAGALWRMSFFRHAF
jgi:hypothetical protein